MIEYIRGIHANVEIDAVRGAEGAAERCVQAELIWAGDGVASGVAPLARCRSGVGGWVQEEARRSGIEVCAGVVGSKRASETGAVYGRQIDRGER